MITDHYARKIMDVVNSLRSCVMSQVVPKEEHQLQYVPDSAITEVCGCDSLWGVKICEVIHWKMV